jgi:hypothetical protein
MLAGQDALKFPSLAFLARSRAKARRKLLECSSAEGRKKDRYEPGSPTLVRDVIA